MFTCQPMPRLSTEGGTGVALASLATAIKPPVDCSKLKNMLETIIKNVCNNHVFA